MEIVDILNFIQAIIWPFIILIVLYIFAAPFKTILTSFNTVIHERGVKLTPTGIEIPSPDSNTVENITNEISSPKQLNKIFLQNIPEDVDDSVSQEDIESNPTKKHERQLVLDIKKTLNSIYEENNDKMPKENLQENLLIEAYVCLYFERSFHRILGSQLNLLKKLYKASNLTISQEAAELIFNDIYQENYNTTFERWSEYLINSDFIKKIEDNNYLMTELGKEFFEYIVERQYVLNKAG